MNDTSRSHTQKCRHLRLIHHHHHQPSPSDRRIVPFDSGSIVVVPPRRRQQQVSVPVIPIMQPVFVTTTWYPQNRRLIRTRRTILLLLPLLPVLPTQRVTLPVVRLPRRPGTPPSGWLCPVLVLVLVHGCNKSNSSYNCNSLVYINIKHKHKP